MKKLFKILLMLLMIGAGIYYYLNKVRLEDSGKEASKATVDKVAEIAKVPDNTIYNKTPQDEAGKVVKIEHTTDVDILAKQVILIDAATGKILLEKNATEEMVPSSMSKMMTSYLVEEKIIKGDISVNDAFLVSEKAWRMQGSKMFVPLGEKLALMDLLRGVIIQSGNDACIVLAEGVSGSEEIFVREMNDMAKKMGLKHTNFKNSSGWPEPGHYSTALDLAILGSKVVYDHPDFYKIYSEKTFTFGKNHLGKEITQGNRNPLLYDSLGCDGIKTGHTDDGGFGMVGSFVDGPQRYIMVINGLPSMQARADEAKKLLRWGRENFITKQVFKEKDVIAADAPINLGVKKTVRALAHKNVDMLVPRLEQGQFTSKTELKALEAPIKAGDVVGKAYITSSMGTAEVDLIAEESVEKVGFLKRMVHLFLEMIS